MTYEPKILIVDDDHSLCNSLKGFLNNQAARILTAHNGREAIELLEKDKIDLILLDVVMPEIGGYQVMDYIESQGLETLVILMTGYAPTDSEVPPKGAYGYLIKPFDLEKLVTTIENALDDIRLNYDRQLEVERDRRRHPRSEVNWPVVIESPQGSKSGEARNISSGGAFIICDKPLAPNEVFDLSIQLRDRATSLLGRAQVVWANE